jgi:hypothetical protein
MVVFVETENTTKEVDRTVLYGRLWKTIVAVYQHNDNKYIAREQDGSLRFLIDSHSHNPDDTLSDIKKIESLVKFGVLFTTTKKSFTSVSRQI